MSHSVAPDAGPDGFGPIDAVVTWVDGSDPDFLERRKVAVERLKRDDRALAKISEVRFAPSRYVQHDEIRYCVRSILNHAPWVRRIWLVTDDQFPAVFDRAALDPRVVLVSHRELFRELPDALPVFNSGAIEVLLWKIDGISDRFVTFNDDFFLTKPVTPGHFFAGERPVLRGKWVSQESSPPAWLQRRINSAELFGFGADHFFKEAHTPYSLSRPALATLFSEHPELMERMARRQFRSADDHYVVALHNHFCLANGLAELDEANRWLVFGNYPKDLDEAAVHRSLARIASGQFLSTCFNALGEFVARVPDIHRYLDQGTGPAAPFERVGSGTAPFAQNRHTSPGGTVTDRILRWSKTFAR